MLVKYFYHEEQRGKSKPFVFRPFMLSALGGNYLFILTPRLTNYIYKLHIIVLVLGDLPLKMPFPILDQHLIADHIGFYKLVLNRHH